MKFRPLIFVVGPTASGKSALGLELARAFGGSILNTDSLQVYRRLDIGTAKPSVAERRIVPHFLFDCMDPGQSLTAGDYRRLALSVLEAELPRAPVIAVGGSGFYIQALEKGMFEVPKPDPALEAAVRAQVKELGPEWAWSELNARDPSRAAELNVNDHYRVTRALIILQSSGGKSMSELQHEFEPVPPPWPILKIGLDPDRATLKTRVTKRTERMLRSGLVEEVRALVAEGFGDWPALSSVGYRECQRYLKGEIREHELAGLITLKTMQLAKKQRTWFRRDAEINWFADETDFAAAKRLVAQALTAAENST